MDNKIIPAIGNNISKRFILVSTLLLAAALFLPYGYSLDLGPGPDQVRALAWEYLDAPWFSGIRVATSRIFESIGYTLPRYLFIFLFLRLYRGHANQKGTIWIGILGELFPGIVSLFLILGWVQGWSQPPQLLIDHQFPIYIPIPSLLFVSLGIMKVFPLNTLKDHSAS